MVGSSEIEGINFVDYVDERQLDDVMALVGRDLSEPYSSTNGAVNLYVCRSAVLNLFSGFVSQFSLIGTFWPAIQVCRLFGVTLYPFHKANHFKNRVVYHRSQCKWGFHRLRCGQNR
jgi:hypothetical protein